MMTAIGTIGAIMRYPVKSMLGEHLNECDVDISGLYGDRAYALLDAFTGKIASAKQPNMWRNLLEFRASTVPFPDFRSIVVCDGLGNEVGISDPDFDTKVSGLIGKKIKLVNVRMAGIELNRARPDEVMADGFDAAVTQDVLAIGAAAPTGGFFDYAPIHLMTSASLDAVRSAAPAASIDAARYRPNIMIETELSTAFGENMWIGRKLRIGQSVSLEVIAPTPRCAVPMLPHGNLPQSREAVSLLNTMNKIEFPLLGPGKFPCLGAYAAVLTSGAIRCGDPIMVE